MDEVVDLTPQDQGTLQDAFTRLENPSLAIRLSSTLGMPLESIVKRLSAKAPATMVEAVSDATRAALEYVLLNAARTLPDSLAPANTGLHKAAAITTGAVSGFFGIQTLLIELPITTAIMFRSIVDIARAEGESPRDGDTLLNAMQVFAMGSNRSARDDAAETAYYGTRIALSKAMAEALQYVATHGVGNASAPVMIRFVGALAQRFGIVVTQKTMAQTIPVVGAIGGGLVNTMFISHFQDMARGHFAIRRLERKYGAPVVQAEYQALLERAGDTTRNVREKR